MEKIWAPWRKTYILNVKKKGCFFCDIIKGKEKGFLLFKDEYSCVVMNIFPYNSGHIMVAPLKHKKIFEEFTEQEKNGLFFVFTESIKIIKKQMKPAGINAGLNLGKYAGAGVPGHLHFHIVPRWTGDTNFMPVISNTKVISQSLEDVYNILKPAFNKIKYPPK
jgi:ATP adenylyltransferase